jgi:uncharacterized protein (TIGR02145 family)
VIQSLPAACAATTEDVREDHGYQHSDGGADAAPDATEAPDATDAPADGGAREDGGAETFTDPRDGRTYRTVQIGDATWFAENLDHAIDGASFCYGDDEASCEADGRLYMWSVARTACPPGSHLGSDAEWQALEAALGMTADERALEGYTTPRGTDEGKALRDPAGFAARMAGYRGGSTYDARGNRTYFWTASTRAADVWRRRITAEGDTVFRFTNPPSTFAISVRCVVH